MKKASNIRSKVVGIIRSHYVLLLILVLAIILRLFSINQSLWLDEAIGAEAVRDFSFKELLLEFPKFDNHPPLYYLDLKLWTLILGYSEFALRAPSVIYGIGTILITFQITKRLSDNKLFHYGAILLLATSQLHIYYSQEARMYSLAAFLVSLAVFSFLFLLEKNYGNYYFLIFSFSITAFVFTDYVPVFMMPAFWIFPYIKRKKRGWWNKFLLSHSPILFLGLLWLPIFFVQLEKGSWLLNTLPAWRDLAGGATLKQAGLVWAKFAFGRISLANKAIYYSLILITSVPILFSLFHAYKYREKRFNVIWMWLVLPLALGFAASLVFPAFIYFRFLFVLPSFYVLTAWGITNIKTKQIGKLLLGILVAFNFISWLVYVTDEKQQREKWREATQFVESSALANEIAMFSYPEPFTPFRWYSTEGIDAIGASDSISANPIATKARTLEAVEGRNGVYYFEYLSDLSDPNGIIEETLINEGFTVKNVKSFIGVGEIVYYQRN